jgi:hypothetical protein
MKYMLRRFFVKVLLSSFLLSSFVVASMDLFTAIIPTLGYYAQKNPSFFKEFNVGFGGSSNFGFASTKSGERIWVSAKDLILNENISDSSYYSKIKNFNGGSFHTLQAYLNKSKFFTIWITRGWHESWYNVETIQALMDSGRIPVFNYWYFGDTLGGGMPTSSEIAAYRADTQRVANLLGQLNGTKMLVMEPEFNKDSVMATTTTQRTFANILIEAIGTIRNQNSKLLVSVAMTDQGRRSLYSVSSGCGYSTCALGDQSEWSKLDYFYNYIASHIEFISFYQIVGQFSRDHANPGSWSSPNPKASSAEEVGIDYLPARIVNLTKFLRDRHHKPLFIPYIAVPTATWSDSNNNDTIEASEVNPNGWVGKAENTYRGIMARKATLQSYGLFGFATMELFDNPRHDIDGYQFLMNNSYHLGIVGSSATDEVDIATYGDLEFKGTILNAIFGS